MHFGHRLKNSIYPPWEEHYIDYQKLKSLLREHDTTDKSQDLSDDDATSSWTEQDEENFVQELINVQLDKVHSFQAETYKQLRQRTAECEAKLRPIANPEEAGTLPLSEEERRTKAKEVEHELDEIIKEVSELEKYSRINFTGFLKAAKKHDRKRGSRYRVRPLLQVRLGELPFNSENYSPLLYQLSTMYSFVRHELDSTGIEAKETPSADAGFDHENYTSRKFWVHEDNLMEVKTYILRRLPVLVYRPKPSQADLDMTPMDPTITSIYFDNRKFDLYTGKVERAGEAKSLRLRWTGDLEDKPAIYIEKKIVTESGLSREVKVPLKEKYIHSFLSGDYKLDKTVHKMESRETTEQIDSLKRAVGEIQSFIKENKIEPVMRANYTRTAFQIPGDDRVRVSLDTNLALIREDALDQERPCRDPSDWHRRDIDDGRLQYPFSSIRKGEISRFPYSVLEVRVKANQSEKRVEWINDLMASHLVKEAPRFSKFVHGVAALFEDYVNSFPFWLGELEKDIRRDPEIAFQEEQERLAKRAEDEFTVGSFLGTRHSPSGKMIVGSPVSRRRVSEVISPQPRPTKVTRQSQGSQTGGPSDQDQPLEAIDESPTSSTGLSALFPKFSMTRYARAHWQGKKNVEDLPPGVRHPGTWIKDSGPVRVEAKVWLANQRTFIKWQHISILLASLSLGLYNAAGENNSIARALAIVYTCFAIFAGVWGWWMYEVRSRLIRQRSGRDFDNVFGPLVVCLGLAVALVLNFAFKYSATMSKIHKDSLLSASPAALNNVNESMDSWRLVKQPGAGTV